MTTNCSPLVIQPFWFFFFHSPSLLGSFGWGGVGGVWFLGARGLPLLKVLRATTTSQMGTSWGCMNVMGEFHGETSYWLESGWADCDWPVSLHGPQVMTTAWATLRAAGVCLVLIK